MFFSILKFILWPIFRLFLYPYKIINKENLIQDGNTIIVSNHLGKADVIYTAYIFKGKSIYLAKKEWFDNKFLGFWLKLIGAVSVDREGVDIKAIKTVLKSLKDDKRVIVFPEGTRNKESLDLLPLKDGPGYFAHKCNSTILPITIANRPKMFRKNYIYIGEPIKLDNIEKKFSAEVNEEITNIIRDALLDCREKVDIYLENKKKKK